MKKFNVGQQYHNICWFTGASCIMEVFALQKNSVTFTVTRTEADGIHTCLEEYHIDHDSEGNESVLIYDYHGKENRIFAM